MMMFIVNTQDFREWINMLFGGHRAHQMGCYNRFRDKEIRND